MAKPLEALTIAAPGFLGLNTQDAGITLDPNFATTANNCVIDNFGRLGARKGWEYLTTTGGVGTNLTGAHSFIDLFGNRTILSWSQDTFYKGDTTLSPITDNTTAFASNNYQAVTLNDKAYFVSEGEEPRYYDPVTDAVDFISTAGNTNPAEMVGITGANCALSAYGRLWVADTDTAKTTIYWSDLLDGTNFSSGTAGSLDLSSVLVNGNDTVTALGAHAGRLIIFCRNTIVIYADNDGDSTLNPTTMQLVEVLAGIGSVERDSLQNTGSDILFLSKRGVQSLGRVLQEKSQPMRDISKNIRDDLINAVQGELTHIRTVYSTRHSFYLVLLPTYNRVYCFDMRTALEDGSSRVTVWDSMDHMDMLAVGDDVYFCQKDGLGIYRGYLDNGKTYRLKYYTAALDAGDSTRVKYLKRLAITLIGGSQQSVVFKVSGDYGGRYKTYTASVDPGTTAEYGIAQYNTEAEYNADGLISDTVRVPAGESGEILQVGFEADINANSFSVQKLSIYLKQGRVY